MSDSAGQEPTAIRNPLGGKTHKVQGFGTACNRLTWKQVDVMDRLPLSSVPPADRCRVCWPAALTPTTETKETN